MNVTLVITLVVGALCFALPPQLMVLMVLLNLYSATISHPSLGATTLCFFQLFSLHLIGPRPLVWIVPFIWLVPLLRWKDMKKAPLVMAFLPASFLILTTRPNFGFQITKKLHRALRLAWLILALSVFPIFSLVDDVPPDQEDFWYAASALTSLLIFLAIWKRKKIEDYLLSLGRRLRRREEKSKGKGLQFFDQLFRPNSPLTLVSEETTSLFVATVICCSTILVFLLPITLLYMNLVIS